MASSAKPKSAKPGNRAVPAAEPDAAALLPPDLPSDCPFSVTWRPAVFAVHAADGINLSTIKDAFKQLHVLSHISISDLAAQLDPADPLCAEIAAAAAEGQQHAAAGEGASVPVSIAAKLLQRQFDKDEPLAWKFEIVRRRDQLARLEAEAKVAHDVLSGAESAQAAASSRLQAVNARLPQPAPPPAQQDAAASTGSNNADGSTSAGEDDDFAQPKGNAGGAVVPPLKLQQLPPEEVTLSPEQRRALNEAQAGLEAADNELKAAKASVCAADAALAAAQAGLNGPFQHYEPYWVEGLASTAAGLSAAVSAGIPLRAVVWLHPSPQPPSADGSATRQSNPGTRPASGISAKHSAAGCVPAAVVHCLPGELQQLQDAIRACAWDSELSGLLVLQLPVEDAASPFTKVPASSSITDPAWAAASSAAAAARATAAAAAATAAATAPAPDAKPGAAAGAKPGSAAAAGAKTSSSGTARPGSSAPGGSGAAAAAAAAVLPEEVPGCKELARALLTVRDQAKRFDQWRNDEVHVYRMPAPAAQGSGSNQHMEYFSHLLDSVPAERQSIPLVVHAMIEQVRQNSFLESSPEAAAEADQAILAAQVEDAISAAFRSLVDDQSCFMQEPCQQSTALTLLQHGDDLAAAACGLTTGYVHGHTFQQQSESAHGSCSTQPGGSCADWPFAARGLSSQDVDAIEQHMLQLLQLPGLSGAGDSSMAGDAGSGFDPAIDRQLQQAELKSICKDVHYATVQRSQLLAAAAGMLPPEVQAAHAADLLTRKYQEHLQPQVLKQVLQHCSHELPHISSMRYQPAGAELVALYAGPQTETAVCCSMPHAMTFNQYWQTLLKGSCQAPELKDKVYEMSEAAAHQQWQHKVLYTEAGGIAATGSEGLLALRQGPHTVRLLQPEQPGKPYQLVATLDRGTVAAAAVLTVPEPSPKQPDVVSSAEAHALKDTRASDASSMAAPSVTASAARASEASSVSAAAAAGKNKALGSAAKVRPSTGQGSLGTVLENAADEEEEQQDVGLVEADAGRQHRPEWAALSVSTPQGLVVQVSTDGCVLMEPVGQPGTQCMQATAVDVLGAPLAAGALQAQVPASTSAWHAVLPNGTLIKGAAAAADGAMTQPAGSTPAAVLHLDGTMSQQQQHDLTLSAATGEMKQQVAGWLRTTPQGEQVWVVDTVALQNLRSSLAKAAEEAAAAAAAAAEAAAAAAAAWSTGKKSGKGSKSKALDKQASSKTPSAKHKEQQQQLAQDQTVAAAAGAAEQSGTSRVSEGEHPQSAAAVAEAALQDLEQQPPQSMGNIRAVRLTDADTGAIVTTREDHLLIVDYPDGSRLLQDAEGCRMSHVGGTWLFEAAGLPAVKGDETGITLEPCPGVCLTWDAGSRCVTLVHTATDAVISLAPTGHVAYSPVGKPVEPLLDCCMDLVEQQQQQPVHQPEGVQEQDQVGAKAQPQAQHVQAGAPDQQLQQKQMDGEAPTEAPAVHDAAEDDSWQTLADICNRPDCWGLLGLDLMTGEAALHEEDSCRLYIAAGGCIQVWNNGHPAEAPAVHDVGAAAAATDGVEGAAPDSAALAGGEQAAAAPVSAASAAAAAAAEAAAAAAAAETDESLTDEEVAARKAAAAAAAQAVAEAAAAEAAAAEEAAAAARAVPKPIGPGIKPRLFVIDAASGAGYEVLPWEVVDRYAAVVNAQPGHQHMQQEALGAEEPGTTCHTFLSNYPHKGPALQPLELAQPMQVLPMQVDPDQSLISLRRVQTVAQAEWQAGQGLKLPRIAALNPWHLAHAAAAAPGDVPSDAAIASAAAPEAFEGLAATRLPESGAGGWSGAVAGGCAGQVVVVREVLELPELGPEVQEQVAAAVAAWQAHRAEQQQLLLSRAPSPAHGSRQLKEDAEAVSAMLEDAGFQTLPLDAAAAAAGAAADTEAAQANDHSHPSLQSAGSTGSTASKHGQVAPVGGAAGPRRLEQVKGRILEQQQLAAEAAAIAKAEAAAHAAAEAAAKKKPCKPWVKKVGPYDHTPRKPEPGQTLKYFETQEGLEALSHDPALQSSKRLTKAHLPPPKEVHPASAGKQQVPGVYLASSTALCESEAEAPAADSYAAGLAVLAGSNSPSSTQGSAGGKAGTHGSSSTGSPPKHAPLMHAGRPTRMGSPLAQRQQSPHQQHAFVHSITAVGGAQPAAVTCDSEQVGSSIGSSAGKGPWLDVYGQPRAVPPALPATYSKAHAAGSLNAEYLAREGATIRATKTSSASLVRASGKDGKQIVLRPAHVHFGSIPVGSVVHRTAKLLNGSPDVVRFTLLRPDLPLRVLHKPAPLPPGMEASFTVELVAEQPGDFVGEVTVKTELNVFSLSVSAKVLPASEQGAGSGVVPVTESSAEAAGQQVQQAS